MSHVILTIVAALVFTGAIVAQDPVEKAPGKATGKTVEPAEIPAPKPKQDGNKPDPLALPFPREFQSIRELGVWSVNAQSAAHRRMYAARRKGDRAEVARLVTRLDKARQHAARLLRKMQEKIGPRT